MGRVASLVGEIAGALALAVRRVGAEIVRTEPDGTMIVARDGCTVALTLEVRPLGGQTMTPPT